MAIFHLSAAIVSRGSKPKGKPRGNKNPQISAVAKAAYEARESIKDQNQGITFNYKYKAGLIDQGIATPDEAAEWMRSRAKLWNGVEQKENESKRWETAQLARRFIFALPHELPQNEKVSLTKTIAGNFANHGIICDWAVHKADQNGDERNDHAHLMTTLRTIENGEFGNKNRLWNSPEFLKQIRQEVCDITNQYLLKYNVQVDHRSYTDQGIDKKPTVHKGAAITRKERVQKKEVDAHNKKIDGKIEALNKEGTISAINKKIIAIETEKRKNIKKPVVSTVAVSEIQKQDVPKPEVLTPTAVNSKEIIENAFVSICNSRIDDINKILTSEVADIKKRKELKLKGNFDEHLDKNTEITVNIINMFNLACEKKDFDTWNSFFTSLTKIDNLYKGRYMDTSNYKYMNNHYRIYESIRQPLLKIEQQYKPINKNENTNTKKWGW